MPLFLRSGSLFDAKCDETLADLLLLIGQCASRRREELFVEVHGAGVLMQRVVRCCLQKERGGRRGLNLAPQSKGLQRGSWVVDLAGGEG